MSKKNKRKQKQQKPPLQSRAPQPSPGSNEPSTGPSNESSIDDQAYALFLKEGGGELELMIQTGQLTVEAFDSQMRAARDGGEGWGPTVTPYEDRMNRGLQLRLIKEKRQWLKDCRQRIEQQQEAQQEDAQPETNEPTPKSIIEAIAADDSWVRRTAEPVTASPAKLE